MVIHLIFLLIALNDREVHLEYSYMPVPGVTDQRDFFNKPRAIGRLLLMITLALCILVGGCGMIVLHSPSAEDLAGNRDFMWRVDNSPHFRVYYETRSYANQHMEAIKRSNEEAYVRSLTLLNLESYDDLISVFVVGSRQEMKRLIGWETNGSAFPNQNLISYIVSDSIKAHGAHEIMHVISVNSWGDAETWIKEGLAVYADDNWWGYDLHALSSYVMRRDRLVRLAEIISRFGDVNDLISYPEAGSFVKFLYEQYGLDAVRQVWTCGLDSLGAITGKKLELLEREWIALLNEQDTTDIKYPIHKSWMHNAEGVTCLWDNVQLCLSAI